jgi:hypothetical protein
MFPHLLQKRLFIDHLSGLENDDRGHWPTACRPRPGGSIDAPAGNRPQWVHFGLAEHQRELATEALDRVAQRARIAPYR